MITQKKICHPGQEVCHPEQREGSWFLSAPPAAAGQHPISPGRQSALPKQKAPSRRRGSSRVAQLTAAAKAQSRSANGRDYSITSIGSTITNFPIEPLFRNLIRPVIFAKSVSSLPRPTLSPGFTRVPRCRTMMVPPGTICPPNALNPSRCAFESRPFREVSLPFFMCHRSTLSLRFRDSGYFFS